MAHRKTTFLKRNLVQAQAISADYAGPVSDIRDIDRVCYQMGITGDVQGQITIQGSVDYDPSNPTLHPGTWIDLPITLDPIGGTSQNYLVDIQETAVPFIRPFLSYTSGNGDLTVHVSGKES